MMNPIKPTATPNGVQSVGATAIPQIMTTKPRKPIISRDHTEANDSAFSVLLPMNPRFCTGQRNSLTGILQAQIVPLSSVLRLR